MSRNCTYLAIATTLASLTGINGAVAFENWPSIVIGTWSGMANQTGLTLHIATQGPGPGQPNGVNCPEITGTFVGSAGDTENVHGFYCPHSGRIVFRRPLTGFEQVCIPRTCPKPDRRSTWADCSSRPAGGEYSFFAHKP
jgi:hypothetical protein